MENNKHLTNNISSLQNNYYKECKQIGKYRNNNNLLSIPNNMTKGHSSSKNKYKVTYSNSILEHNIIPNKNIENRNIYNTINFQNKNSKTEENNLLNNFCKCIII